MTQWYCKSGDRESGPFSADELREMATTQVLQPDDLLRKGPTGRWHKASQVKGLFVAPPKRVPWKEGQVVFLEPGCGCPIAAGLTVLFSLPLVGIGFSIAQPWEAGSVAVLLCVVTAIALLWYALNSTWTKCTVKSDQGHWYFTVEYRVLIFRSRNKCTLDPQDEIVIGSSFEFLDRPGFFGSSWRTAFGIAEAFDPLRGWLRVVAPDKVPEIGAHGRCMALHYHHRQPIFLQQAPLSPKEATRRAEEVKTKLGIPWRIADG